MRSSQKPPRRRAGAHERSRLGRETVRRRSAPRETIRHLERALADLSHRRSPEGRARARAETILAHLVRVPVAVLIANNSGRYIEANDAASALTGYSHAELMRIGLPAVTPIGRESVRKRLWSQFLERGRMAGRYRIRRKDGIVIVAEYVAFANVLPGLHVSALMPVRSK
jgi:PAS domain S-box-containing protein